MPTSYQKFREYLLTKYKDGVTELKPTKTQFREIFFMNASNDPKQVKHVQNLMVERGELKMLSDTGYFVYLDKIRENKIKDEEVKE